MNDCDNSYTTSHRSNNSDEDNENEAKGILAGLLVLLMVSAIIDDDDNSHALAANDMSSQYNKALDKFAAKLPSIYNN